MPAQANKNKPITKKKAVVAAKKTSKNAPTAKAASKRNGAVHKVAKKTLVAKNTSNKNVTVKSDKKPAKTVTSHAKLTNGAKLAKTKPATKASVNADKSTKARKPATENVKTMKSERKVAAGARAQGGKPKGITKGSVSLKADAKKTKTEKISKEKRKQNTIMTAEIADVAKKVVSTGSGFLGIAPYAEQEGEEYMNDHQRVHFRSLLERWKHELMQEVDRTMHHMKDEAGNYPDLSDRASQEEEFNLELRARDRERKLIWKIDEALERIEKDDYGYCDACGVEIGIRRLEARPTATLCIDCKTLDEIREKQTRA
jgi:DnaK suppressor protein